MIRDSYRFLAIVVSQFRDDKETFAGAMSAAVSVPLIDGLDVAFAIAIPA